MRDFIIYDKVRDLLREVDFEGYIDIEENDEDGVMMEDWDEEATEFVEEMLELKSQSSQTDYFIELVRRYYDNIKLWVDPKMLAIKGDDELTILGKIDTLVKARVHRLGEAIRKDERYDISTIGAYEYVNVITLYQEIISLGVNATDTDKFGRQVNREVLSFRKRAIRERYEDYGITYKNFLKTHPDIIAQILLKKDYKGYLDYVDHLHGETCEVEDYERIFDIKGTYENYINVFKAFDTSKGRPSVWVQKLQRFDEELKTDLQQKDYITSRPIVDKIQGNYFYKTRQGSVVIGEEFLVYDQVELVFRSAMSKVRVKDIKKTIKLLNTFK